jgi:hypothetical protein
VPVVVADWAAVGEGARHKKLVEEMAYHQVVGDGEAIEGKFVEAWETYFRFREKVRCYDIEGA